MNIQKYLVFIKTVEYGSFTKAAEALGYSQSGISRMVVVTWSVNGRSRFWSGGVLAYT